MASSGGNSSKFQSSSEENLQIVMDERKNKRKQSNRESAKRSRMRKQKHVDDMLSQVSQLTKDNSEILATINITTQHYINVEAENSVLRAQMDELNQRLQSLNDIIGLINTTTTTTTNGSYSKDHHHHHHHHQTSVVQNDMNMLYHNHHNQPITTSADICQW